MSTLPQIKYYTRGNNTTNGTTYLLDGPYQLSLDDKTSKKLRDDAPATIKINKHSSYHYDATTGQSIICYNIIVSSYDILDTINKLNQYIDSLNQQNKS